MNTFRFIVYTACAAIAAFIVWDKTSNAKSSATGGTPVESVPAVARPASDEGDESGQPAAPSDSAAPPQPAEHPVAVPEATPPLAVLAPPKPKRAPKGTLYVIKPFSVSTEFGVYGFRAGTKVSVLREEGGALMVFDGTKRGSATKDHFTDDLELVESMKLSIPQIAR